MYDPRDFVISLEQCFPLLLYPLVGTVILLRSVHYRADICRCYGFHLKAWCLYIAVIDKLELHLVKEELVFAIEFASLIRLEILVFLKFLPLPFFSSRNSCCMNQKTCVVITFTCQIGCQFPF